MSDKHCLKPLMRRAFRDHIEEDGGLITSPERLLELSATAVRVWLKHHESLYRDEEMEQEAEVLRDLRFNLIEPNA